MCLALFQQAGKTQHFVTCLLACLGTSVRALHTYAHAHTEWFEFEESQGLTEHQCYSLRVDVAIVNFFAKLK